MAKVERAIIQAAGLGTRLAPYTTTCPKPLLAVNGKAMIQTIIDALHQNGIYEIYVVVGYQKEKFSSLKGVTLIENVAYQQANNISSLYVAREKLRNCLIIDGDQIIHDPYIFKQEYSLSGYFAHYQASYTKEWMLTCDEKYHILSCSRDGGKEAYQLYGISYWNQEDGQKLASLVEKVYLEEKKTQLYWDDVALFCYPEEFTLRVYLMEENSVQEIDSKEEYEAILSQESLGTTYHSESQQ